MRTESFPDEEIPATVDIRSIDHVQPKSTLACNLPRLVEHLHARTKLRELRRNPLHAHRRAYRRERGNFRRLAASALLGAYALLLSGCIYFTNRTPAGACANDLGSPVRHFCVVTPGILWRGARPDRAAASWLLEHGVGTIVSLELDVRHAFETVRPNPRLRRSVTYFQVHSFSAVQVVTHAHLDEHVAFVLAVIKEAPKPVFVNCRAGVDRTGLMVAAYRVIIEGMSRKRAIAEMERFRSPWGPLNARYIHSLSGARLSKIRHDMQRWQSRLRPSGRFDCRNGRCHFVRQRTELNSKPRPR